MPGSVKGADATISAMSAAARTYAGATSEERRTRRHAALLEAALDLGTPSRIQISSLRGQAGAVAGEGVDHRLAALGVQQQQAPAEGADGLQVVVLGAGVVRPRPPDATRGTTSRP